MKKLVSLLLCIIMVSSVCFVTACSKENNKVNDDTTKTDVEESSGDGNSEDAIPDYGDTKGAQLCTEFATRASKSDDIEAIAEELCSADISGYDCLTMPVEEGFLNGFSSEIKGFNKGVMFSPSIGSIPFVAYIFETEDTEALKKTLLDNADPRWNICTEADETFAGVYKNYVFFVMLPNE